MPDIMQSSWGLCPSWFQYRENDEKPLTECVHNPHLKANILREKRIMIPTCWQKKKKQRVFMFCLFVLVFLTVQIGHWHVFLPELSETVLV